MWTICLTLFTPEYFKFHYIHRLWHSLDFSLTFCTWQKLVNMNSAGLQTDIIDNSSIPVDKWRFNTKNSIPYLLLSIRTSKLLTIYLFLNLHKSIWLSADVLKNQRWEATTVDTDQMPHTVASELGLHCLLRHVRPNIRVSTLIFLVLVFNVTTYVPRLTYYFYASYVSILSNNLCLPICLSTLFDNSNYNRISLSRLRLSGVTTYLEMKIWSLF